METCGNWRVTPSCALCFTVPLLLVSRDGSLRALINMSKRGTVLHCCVYQLQEVIGQQASIRTCQHPYR